MTGLLGGLAGGAIALNLDNDPTATPVPAAATAIATPPPSETEQLRAAIARALPTVVTVIADLPPQPQSDGSTLETQNFGSGIVVSDQGLVVTNFHVIDGAAKITVVLSTAERRPAVLVADDSPFTDLAILAIDPTGLRVATFGDSDALQLGDPVAAIASGLVTFDNQVTVGILSARQSHFPRPGVTLLDMLQTDAAVNHGDSGGALINIDGEVVGLLTTVVRESGGAIVEGVALAQSSNTIRPIIEAVAATGVNPRPRIGIERVTTDHIPIDPQVQSARDLPVSFGAVIVNIEPGSPAAAAGVQVGDIVVGVDGVQIDANYSMVDLLARAQVGQSLDLYILRDQQQLIIPVVPQVIAPAPASGSGS